MENRRPGEKVIIAAKIHREERDKFFRAASELAYNASELLRKLIRDFLVNHERKAG